MYQARWSIDQSGGEESSREVEDFLFDVGYLSRAILGPVEVREVGKVPKQIFRHNEKIINSSWLLLNSKQFNILNNQRVAPCHSDC